MKGKMTGKMIGGRYEVLDQIDSGGSAGIYLCRDVSTPLSKMWAAKIVPKDIPEETLAQYRREMNILDGTDHPSIPEIHYFSEDEENLYIIMSFINGYSLRKKVKQEGLQSEMDVREWAAQTAAILDYLHNKNFVFADVHPKNIMMDEFGHTRLIDFGIAEKITGERSTEIAQGTRGYSAPEQYPKGSRILDRRTDVYGLGATIFHLLTGKKPEACDPRKYNPRITPAMSRIVQKAMSFDPKDRYQNMKLLERDLEDLKRLDKDNIRRTKKQYAIIMVAMFITTMLGVFSLGSYDQMVKASETSYTAHLSNAQTLSQKGDIDGARDEYLEAVSAKPDETTTYKELFEMLLPAEGNPNVAAQTKSAVDTIRYIVDPAELKGDPELLLTLTEESLGIGEPVYSTYAQNCIKALKKTALYKKNREKIDAYDLISQYAVSGSVDYDKVVQAVSALLALPDEQRDAESYFTIVRMYNLFPDALADTVDLDKLAKDAVSSEKGGFNKSVLMHEALANRYFVRYQDNASKSDLAKAEDLIDDFDNAALDAETLNLLAKIRFECGNYAGAKESYKDVLAADPNDKTALLGMTAACIAEQENGARDWTEAQSYYNRLASAKNLSAETLNQLASLKKKMN